MRLVETLAAPERIAEVFSDESVLRAMLDFEVALGRACARCGVIPKAAAKKIAAAAKGGRFDGAQMAALGFRAGTPVIPLVGMLADAGAGEHVHRGATSQDVMDTAVVLLLRRCLDIFAVDHARLRRALAKLSQKHSGTVMLSRTLLQPATPITFGFKAAGWYAAEERGWGRVTASARDGLVLQFGGASGTLASLGDRRGAVAEALAQELGLVCPDAAWHAHRDRLGALLGSVAVYVATLGKIALDVALLMQWEVGEAAEPRADGRGGSSAMPHKRNPAGCMLTIAAARRTPGLVANFLNGMIQEHERAVGGWQAEWSGVEGVMKACGVALESMVEVAEGLEVNAAKMRANVDACSAVLHERVPLTLDECVKAAETFRRRLLGKEGE
ncbi:MAG: lyase family protein [Bryobacteraceae bacterium]